MRPWVVLPANLGPSGGHPKGGDGDFDGSLGLATLSIQIEYDLADENYYT